MKHIQKLADALLKMFAPGGVISNTWAEASNESLHIRYRDGHDAVDAWEEAWMELQETNHSVWEVNAIGDTRSSDALYLKAEAYAYPETSKLTYRLTVYVDISTTQGNELTVVLERGTPGGTFKAPSTTLYKTGAGSFSAEEWSKVSKSQKSPEKVLRKFLEDFDKKGFALR
jgi:hypothetical protein